MRRALTVLALAGAAVAASGGTASAAPVCYGLNTVGVCVEYVCVDLCAPEYHVDPYCSVATYPPSALVERTCALVDRIHVVVP